MALVSELSMNQAQALKLQQEARQKEALLEQCYLRMEKGEPPTEEMEYEWEKMLADMRRQAEEGEARRMVC